jgi:hypothetical protein
VQALHRIGEFTRGLEVAKDHDDAGTFFDHPFERRLQRPAPRSIDDADDIAQRIGEMYANERCRLTPEIAMNERQMNVSMYMVLIRQQLKLARLERDSSIGNALN